MHDQPQNYANHRVYPPLYLIAGLVLCGEVGRRIWRFVQDPSVASAWPILVDAALVVVWYASRRRAQIVQDRVIRLEMRLRLEQVLGERRRADIARVALPDLVALRFASDAELPALFEEVLAGRFAKRDEIKRRVQDWQADWLRV